VIGAGIFGLAGALALRARGFEVTVLEPGPIPHPLAASTDVSKLVRADYGADLVYTDLMDEALARWEAWNAGWPRPLAHFDGWLALTSEPFAAGGFEADSHATLSARGWPLERLDGEAIARRFPGWAEAGFVDGYLNPRVAWAESSAVVERLAALARARSVVLRWGAASALARDGARVIGARLPDGALVRADHTVVAAGAWTPRLVPELTDLLRPVGQPVFHLRPADAAPYRPPRFPAWAADIGRTGWYGFPATAEGVVKLAQHGAGLPLADVDAVREVTVAMELGLRRFLAERLPSLADAPLVATRLCPYCDSGDGDFLIDRSPDLEGLTVASGGSGHGFKFAPVVGDLIADAVEGRRPEARRRFRWRLSTVRRRESARAGGGDLASRWRATWEGLGAAAPEGALEALVAAWREPGRHYHDVAHLEACLAAAEATAHLAERPAEVALALWYHDAIYDPRARDNEERSAAWAAEVLTGAGLGGEVRDRVVALILATKHNAAPAVGDEALLVDIDLSVLGAPSGAFAAYDAAIRREYAHVPEPAYRAARRAVLRGFMGRPAIYRTPVFRELLEARARGNLASALEGLG